VGPHPGQTRDQVLQLSQLDLQLAFVALRPQRENVQDQRNTIDHAHLDVALDIALLGGGQIVIEQDDFDIIGLNGQRDLLCLAGANEEFGVGAGTLADDRVNDLCACALRKHGEFFGLGFEVRLAEIDADDQRLWRRPV